VEDTWRDIFLACFNGRRTGRIFRVACFQAQDKAHEFYDRNSFDFCISNLGIILLYVLSETWIEFVQPDFVVLPVSVLDFLQTFSSVFGNLQIVGSMCFLPNFLGVFINLPRWYNIWSKNFGGIPIIFFDDVAGKIIKAPIEKSKLILKGPTGSGKSTLLLKDTSIWLTLSRYQRKNSLFSVLQESSYIPASFPLRDRVLNPKSQSQLWQNHFSYVSLRLLLALGIICLNFLYFLIFWIKIDFRCSNNPRAFFASFLSSFMASLLCWATEWAEAVLLSSVLDLSSLCLITPICHIKLPVHLL